MPTHLPTPTKKKPKKKMPIAMNSYRNRHYVVSNNMKKKYKKLLEKKIEVRKLEGPLKMIYTFYRGSRRWLDLGNWCCIQQKFCEDWLVELWLIEDDTPEYINQVEYISWGYDKDHWRVEIEIIENNFLDIIYK